MSLENLETIKHSDEAAIRGLPSYVWRDGQERRWQMLLDAAGDRIKGTVFESGSGVGMYLAHMQKEAKQAVGVEIELPRTIESHAIVEQVVCGVGEYLPLPDNTFDLTLSHEVIEHVQDDRLTIKEIIRTLKPGGRLVLFCPNRGYPFEQHGIYWKGEYRFGNIPLVNYLPMRWRNKLAPHVRVYTRADLKKLFAGLPVKIITKTTIFGAYDNIIARKPGIGKVLRVFLQFLEKTPLRVLGLSHFWVVEKIQSV